MSNEFIAKLQAIVEQVSPESHSQVQEDIDSVLKTGAIFYDDWLKILQNKNVSVDIRETVCWALARLKDERALPYLLSCLKDDNSLLRAESARALGTLSLKQAVQPLISALLEDKDVMVRTSAAYGLGLLHDKTAVEHLVHTLENQNEHPEVRGHAAEALSDIGDNRAIQPLITALKDPSVEVRFWAVFALGQLGTSEAIPELELLAATDESVLTNWGAIKEEASAAIENIQARIAMGE